MSSLASPPKQLTPGTLSLACLLLCTTSGCAGDEEPSCDGLVVTGVAKQYAVETEPENFEPLVGAEVCVFGRDDVPCVTTDERGIYQLCGVPPNQDLLLSFDDPEYAPALRMLVTRNEDYDILAETVLLDLQLIKEQAQARGLGNEAVSGGAIQFFGGRPTDGTQVALEGYSVSLTRSDGSPAICSTGEGQVPCPVFYVDAEGYPDETLTASTQQGIGLISNVTPGEYDLRFSHPQLGCAEKLPESGWGSQVPNAVRVAVFDALLTTQVGMFCEPPQ